MSESSEPSPESAQAQEAVAAKRRSRWQVGIRTLVLLTAACAVWLTFDVNRRHNARLESRIRAMEPLAHELVVTDRTKIAVVRLDELWMDDNKWDLYLPPGAYRLCIATREIDGTGYPRAARSAPLHPGRQRLVLQQQRDETAHHVSVLLDGRPILTVDEPKEWNPGMGSSGGGQFSTSEQMAADKPVELYRKRFMQPAGKPGFSSTPTGPAAGLMLWIEPAPASPAGP